jgi:tRNASer (uridine44-2'-O)-methyltransferase
MHLLAVLHKHGQGIASGYIKRVKHDIILPQAAVQNTYARLKAKYARAFIEGWAESTNPGKHVFEDLGIAAFLIELWGEMYKDENFPGFVDIGCGNGLLVNILVQEGYSGWGFDARKRKSWPTYCQKARENLKEMVLIPSIIQKVQLPIQVPQPNQPTCPNYAKDSRSSIIQATEPMLTNENPLHLNSKQMKTNNEADSTNTTQGLNSDPPINKEIQEVGIHNGLFPKGTFIISNHADELTPWTPILASLSQCPFMMIPCCSHALSGARFRAPPPKDASPSTSAFASLVAWVSKLAKDCGWKVEVEMLRIPSTRNTALIGRRRNVPFEDVDIKDLIYDNGGSVGWEANALKLTKTAARGH